MRVSQGGTPTNPVADLDGSGADVFVGWVDVFGGIDIDDDG